MPIMMDGRAMDADHVDRWADANGIPRELVRVLNTCLPAMMASRSMIVDRLVRTGWCASDSEAQAMVDRMWEAVRERTIRGPIDQRLDRQPFKL